MGRDRRAPHVLLDDRDDGERQRRALGAAVRRAALLLALGVAGACPGLGSGSARGQVLIVYGGPDCVETDRVRLLARGVAAPGGPDAVSTDGFGVRLPEASGEMAGMRTASILDDAVLAWRTPAAGPGSHVACPYPHGLTEEWNAVRLSVEAGNETGDPGPLRYLDPSLPNVDKIGPDYEAAVAVQGRARVSARWRDFLPTDPALAPRVFDAVQGRFPKRKGLALAAEARLSRDVRVWADALGAEDLPFEPTLGREVPVRRQRLGGHVSWSSWYPAWWVDANFRAERLDRPEWSALASGVGPDWQETVAEAVVGHRATLSPYRDLRLEGTLRQRLATGPGLGDGSVTWGEIEADLSGYRGTPTGTARVSLGPSGVGGGASGAIAFASPVDLHARLSASRTLPEAQPGLPFWVARGYSGLASPATPLTLEGAPVPMESARAEVQGQLWRDMRAPGLFVFMDRWLSIQASGAVEGIRGETVLVPQFTLSPEAVAVSGPVQAVAASGAVAEADVSVRASRNEVIMDADPRVFTRVTGWARARVPLAGDAAFRAARDREPTLRVGAHAEHSPDGLLRLDARLEWRAATRWTGWPEP
ncbi:MAG: hypothetical protein AAFQ43_04085, partial [Bacteroidota bacterium]